MSRFLGKDVQSTTGRNLRYIEDISGLNPWSFSSRRIKDALIVSELVVVAPTDKWRIPYLCKLFHQRREAELLGLDQEVEMVNALISSLVKN